MIMVFFPNQELELWRYAESTTEFNPYLEPKKEYHLIETIPCDFQVMGPNETLREFGEILEDTYKIYIDYDVELTHDMVLRIKGEPDTYKITGTPITNNHLLPVHHKKLVVKKQRKPAKLEVQK